MGREVRRVPATWEHPKDERGRYRPMYERDYETVAREWMDGAIAWDNGTAPSAAEHKATCRYYWEWDGGPPRRESYMPTWTPEEATHYQMYEDTSEGTPISPPCESPEVLARWLADNGASAFGGTKATYEQWLPTCRGGWAPSMVMAGGELLSGVEFIAQEPGLPPQSEARV